MHRRLISIKANSPTLFSYFTHLEANKYVKTNCEKNVVRIFPDPALTYQ